MGMGDTFGLKLYTSDDGTQYAVKLSDEVADKGGFADGPVDLAGRFWPWNSRNMRHVIGVSGDGHHCRMPIGTPDNSLYVGGGSFELHGRTYSTSGRIGERRPISAIGG